MKDQDIGDIYVCPEGQGPKDTTGSGEIRGALLGRFVRSLPTPGFEFWYWPVGQNATKLEDASNIKRSQIDFYWNEDGTPRKKK